MRVLLISTPHPLEENPLPPLSLAYLAAALERSGHEVRILDFLVMPYRAEKIRQALDEFTPEMIGATCVTMNYPIAARMLRQCKQAAPEATTVIGGPHVSFTAEETLLAAHWIDFVVMGEGERTIVELARAVESGRGHQDVRGIAFAADGAIARTPSRPLVADLDGLPLPARRLIPISRYHALGVPCTVITSRGCPYGCLFCSAHRMFGRRVRFREPCAVVDEIEMVRQDLGFRLINIVDDTFTANHTHVAGICEEMMRRNLDIAWSAYARVDTMSRDIARLMRRAGCTTVLFGLESADEHILKGIGKGITPEVMRRGVSMATDEGMKAYASFIIGLPGETAGTIEETMAFAADVNSRTGAEYGFHMLAPLPGTELYDRPSAYGLRFLTRDWADFDANRSVTETDTLTAQMAADAMARYDEIVEQAWVYIRDIAAAGDRQWMERLERDEHTAFVWRLLQADVLCDSDGRPCAVPLAPTPLLEELAAHLSREMSVSPEYAIRHLRRLVARQLIEPAMREGRVSWRWRSRCR